MGFDRVYLDEMVTATSPAGPSWIEELRREYRTGSEDEAVRKLAMHGHTAVPPCLAGLQHPSRQQPSGH